MSRMSGNRFDTFSPVLLLFICICAGVLIPVYPFLNEMDGFSFFWPYDFSDKSEAVLLAVLAYGMAFIVFYLAFKFSSRAPKKKTCLVLNPGSSMWKAMRIAYTLIALSALLALISIIGGFSSFLSAGGDRIQRFAGLNSLILLQNCLLGVSMAWFLMLSRIPGEIEGKKFFAWACYSIFVLAVISLQGAKSTIFTFIVSLAVVWHYRRNRVSLSKMLIYGGVIFVILMLYHVVKQELFVVGEVLSIGKDVGLVDSINFFFVAFSGNLMQLQTMAILIDAVPQQLEFQLGSTLMMVVLLWIPSQIFPAKPLTAPGIFTVALWPGKWSDENTTMPPGYFGEMYMNFGWVGIIIGAILLGFLLGRSYRALKQNVGCDLVLGRHAMLVSLILFLFRGELASTVLLFASIFLPFYVLLKICAVKRMQ